mmetsp:Transcript_68629/g.146958  ORF Transcript_68629/g.146958 Transcript_68629/m.146958 type:complete len:245 (-) Transcript_68629:2363-3097(-)
MEGLLDASTLRLCELVWRHREHEMDGVLRVVLPHLCHSGPCFSAGLGQHLQQPLLIVLRPLLNWQLGDLQTHTTALHSNTGDVVLAGRFGHLRDRAFEAPIPRDHGLHRLPAEIAPNVRDDIPRVEVRHRCAPSRTDAVRAVHEEQGDHWAIVRRLDVYAFLAEVLEDRIIVLREHAAGDPRQLREDVTCSRMVLATLQPSAELAAGHEEVDIVRAHKVLRHVHDRALQGGLAVVVGTMLCNVT